MTAHRMIQVHPDGRVLDAPLPGKETLDGLYTAIGCRAFDVVRLEDAIDMWVDDEGLINGSDFNLSATIIANRLGHPGTVLFGSAVIAGGNEEGDTIGLTESQAAAVLRTLAPQADDGIADTIRRALVGAYPFRA
ncbi:DUF3846 domain-containing protein [Curtobacterium sp. VKM Ac-1395]|uniref:DUF3846 domain-containing protein n=1 Tax=Curtobacterium sp. VKM Ac-1395 TaxID=2783815 RepID=UPI00188B2F8B|nr:DUF3846 domain-containing protein [Curtobacterium sp. VKM Ac-1395]MBF4592043.1 DUF3846 domain-containing protein [Curtobacterium sp. VKM Ac-1395]